MTSLSIKGDAKAVIRDLGVVNKKIQKAATNTALNKTTARIYTESASLISASTGLPMAMIKGRNASKEGAKRKHSAEIGLLRKYNSTWKRLVSKTWFGLRYKIPLIKVIHKGDFGHYTKGTLHGKTSSDMFEAIMPKTKHKGLFVRKGQSRLPIQEIKLDLSDVAERNINRAGNRLAVPEFKKFFAHEMNRLAKRKGVAAYRRT